MNGLNDSLRLPDIPLEFNGNQVKLRHMTVSALRHAIADLPAHLRGALVKSVIRDEMRDASKTASRSLYSLLEDYIDVKRHCQILKKGKFVRWSEVKEELDAHHSHSRKKRG
jgi:hypothetical protein